MSLTVAAPRNPVWAASSKCLILTVRDLECTPKWRMAPSPHGAYWKKGVKLGYQDVGCWMMLKYAPMERVKAGWLYTQFCVSKTVSLKKSVTFLHVIRESDIQR